jgi:hypothetical protein
MRRYHTVQDAAIKKYYQRNKVRNLQPYNTRHAIHIYFNTAARSTVLAFCEGAATAFACCCARVDFFPEGQTATAGIERT